MVFENIDWRKLTFSQFLKIIGTENDAFEFAVEAGLIDRECKCDCGRSMVIVKDASVNFGMRFVCSASRSICNNKKSILTSSWFFRAHIGIQKALLQIVKLCASLTYNQAAFFCETGTKKTISDWSSFNRDVCGFGALRLGAVKIGGIGTTVEIDESMVFKRKNHIGRLLDNEMEHAWVFWGICRETGESFVVRVASRDENTLKAALLENVAEGGRIISDGWRSYRNLSNWGNYTHSIINHCENFVDPYDETCHTNTIERQWKTLKSIFPKGTHGEQKWAYLAEYTWKNRIQWHSLTIGERIQCFIAELRLIKF